MARHPSRLVSQAPAVLALSGLDPSGRAGLLADVIAIREAGAQPRGIATALTSQGQRAFAVSPVPIRVLTAQLRVVLEGSRIRSVKLGMVPDAATLRALWEGLGTLKGFRVIDPVTSTSAGDRLSRLAPGDYLALASGQVILTPNLREAAWLLKNRTPLRSAVQAAAAGRALVERGFGAVVIKGGHGGRTATDVVCLPGGVVHLEGPRLPRSRTRHRGTGCRFASVLASKLALGSSIPDAASQAKELVNRYLSS